MTRLQAVVNSSQDVNAQLLVMDTASAAGVLGAQCDPRVAAHADAMIVNVGNFHCLAFQHRHGRVVHLFSAIPACWTAAS